MEREQAPVRTRAQTSLASALLAAARDAPSAIDGLSAVCAAARAVWQADRVSVWVVDVASRTTSPLASSQPHEELTGFARRWARTSLDVAPAFADVAERSLSVELEGRTLTDALPPGFVEDFAIRSAWVTPLRDGDLDAMLCIEPATARPPAASLLEATPVLAVMAARAVAAREAQIREQQLELLMGLAASIAEERSVGLTLTDACERLAATVRARRASVWLDRDGTLAPVTAGYADGRQDRTGLEEFRSAEAPALLREVFHSGAPATVVGDDIYPWWRDHFDLGALLAVPIGVVPDIAGVLVVDSHEPRGFSEHHVRVATAVAANLATLLRLGQLTEARERELRALNEANDAKNVFLSAVSHELRTPLTVIRGVAATLHRHSDELSAAMSHDLTDRLCRNAEKLEQLLLDLLDVDRLARKTIEPARRPTDVAALVGAVAEAFEDGDHTIEVRATPVVVQVDAAQVERIVENLLSNACKYSPAGTTVEIHVEPTAQGVRLTVEDRGPGVPAAVRGAVFEPFHRLDENHASPGTGVGLTLVAKFAELHGGRAWVEDRPGGGARFVVDLPSADHDGHKG